MFVFGNIRPRNNVWWSSSKKPSPPRQYKKSILNSRYIEIFLKGLTHGFGQKLEIFFCLFIDRIGLEIIFDDQWGRKQALLDYKNLYLQSRDTEIFSKGLTPDFGQKLKISYLFVFGQNGHWNNVWRSSS